MVELLLYSTKILKCFGTCDPSQFSRETLSEHLCSLRQLYFELDASFCPGAVKSFSDTWNLPLSVCCPGILNRAKLEGNSSSLGHQFSVFNSLWLPGKCPLAQSMDFSEVLLTLSGVCVCLCHLWGSGLPCWHPRSSLPPHGDTLSLLSVSLIFWLCRDTLLLPPHSHDTSLRKP